MVVGAALLAVATAPSAFADRGSEKVSVTPSDGLVDGQAVDVAGTGFRPATDLTVAMCWGQIEIAIFPPPLVDPGDCDLGTGVSTTSDEGGQFAITYHVTQTIVTARHGTTACGVGDCRIGVFDAEATTSGWRPVNFIAPSEASGVSGRVTASPTCPVERMDDPCPPRPVQTDVEVLAEDGSVVAVTASDSDGYFTIAVDPGDYVLHASYPPGPGRGCELTPVTVNSGTLVHADIGCDTGIR